MPLVPPPIHTKVIATDVKKKLTLFGGHLFYSDFILLSLLANITYLLIQCSHTGVCFSKYSVILLVGF